MTIRMSLSRLPVLAVIVALTGCSSIPGGKTDSGASGSSIPLSGQTGASESPDSPGAPGSITSSATNPPATPDSEPALPTPSASIPIPSTPQTSPSDGEDSASYRPGEIPPGVSYDEPAQIVATTASYQERFSAVLRVAQSQLGVKYQWGHNPDRGEEGFDCSNYVAWVFHHSLGYEFSGASKDQYNEVGWVVERSEMRPGDVLVFDKGGHVGIFVGDGRMIQCGGDLDCVGYLSVDSGYWADHITVVKRLF